MKASYPEVFNRLDQAYAVWEQRMWFYSMLLSMERRFPSSNRNPIEPVASAFYTSAGGYPFENAASTKKRILTAPEGDLRTLLPERLPEGLAEQDFYRSPGVALATIENPVKEVWTVNLPNVLFPYKLGCWVQSSRRMFHLSEDLVHLLEATSLNEVEKKDIRFPFKTFVLTLDTPIEIMSGHSVSCIILDDFSVTTGGIFLLSDQVIRETKILANDYRSLVEKTVRQGNREKFAKLMNAPTWSGSPSVGTFLPWHLVFFEHFTDVEYGGLPIELLVAKHGEMLSGLDAQWMVRLLRIVFGFCLYLRSTDARKDIVGRPEHIKSTVGPEIRKGSKALLDTAEVCRVQSVVKLTSQERNDLRKALSDEATGRDVSAHFRRGFWRRPKGKGDDPTAEKTIWVRHTIVCRHKLPTGAMPLGSGQVLDC